MSYDHNSFVSLNSSPFVAIKTVYGTNMLLVGIYYVSTPNLSFLDVYYIQKATLTLASFSWLWDSGY